MTKKYKAESTKLLIKFVDSSTNKLLFEIRDRNPTNVGELLSSYYVNEIVCENIAESDRPASVTVLVINTYNL